MHQIKIYGKSFSFYFLLTHEVLCRREVKVHVCKFHYTLFLKRAQVTNYGYRPGLPCRETYLRAYEPFPLPFPLIFFASPTAITPMPITPSRTANPCSKYTGTLVGSGGVMPCGPGVRRIRHNVPVSICWRI